MESELIWRELSSDDFTQVMGLRRKVLNALPHPDHYVREQHEEAFVSGHLGEFGLSFGCHIDGDLVAYCCLTTDITGSGEDHEFAACLPRVGDVVLAAMMVAPDLRGRSLHREGINLRLARAARLGARRALVQVSPLNIRSLHSLFAEGFRCVAAVTYPDHRSRLLLSRSVNEMPARRPVRDFELIDLGQFGRIQGELDMGRRGHDVLPSAPGALLLVGA